MLMGQAIRLLRERADMTQMELAEATGVAQTQLSRWELDRVVPSLAQVAAIERGLGLRRGRLLVTAGYVDPDIGDVEAALLTDPRLSPDDREIVAELYRLVLGRGGSPPSPR